MDQREMSSSADQKIQKSVRRYGRLISNISPPICGWARPAFPRPGAERHPGSEQFNLDRHAKVRTASPPAECGSRRATRLRAGDLREAVCLTDKMRSRQRPK